MLPALLFPVPFFLLKTWKCAISRYICGTEKNRQIKRKRNRNSKIGEHWPVMNASRIPKVPRFCSNKNGCWLPLFWISRIVNKKSYGLLIFTKTKSYTMEMFLNFNYMFDHKTSVKSIHRQFFFQKGVDPFLR